MIDKNQLLALSGINHQEWSEASENIRYHRFKVKKSEDKFRIIEAPCKPLKRIQKKLAGIFTNFYSTIIPDAAHGYIDRSISEDRSRDILSNAQAHIGKKFLLNIDLKDFFHQIDSARVIALCQAFDLEASLITEIVKLVTYKQRLPMGSPSSPVISNIVSAPLDLELMNWSKHQRCYYTRYVDDLSFSSNQNIESKKDEIIQLIQKHGFECNMNKIQLFKEHEVKTITGIDLFEDSYKVNPELLVKTEHNIQLLHKAIQWASMSSFYLDSKQSDNSSKLKTIKRSIKGQIQFIKRVEGPDSNNYHTLRSAYKSALTQETEQFEYSFYI